MTLKEYQAFAALGIHDATLEREPIVGFALGLAGEAGEVVDDIKKRIYHGREVPMEHTAEELGDVLWYIANIATQCDLSLEDIMAQNISKLMSRYPDKYFKEDYSGEVWGTHSGEYQGQPVYFLPKGPHIAMYTEADHKFVKFLNKEEKKKYGLDTQKDHGTGKSDELPWD